MSTCATERLIGDAGVRLRNFNGEHEVAASSCVLAQGHRSGTDLAPALSESGISFIFVGDVEKIGRIGGAVHTARKSVVDLIMRLTELP